MQDCWLGMAREGAEQESWSAWSAPVLVAIRLAWSLLIAVDGRGMMVGEISVEDLETLGEETGTDAEKLQSPVQSRPVSPP